MAVYDKICSEVAYLENLARNCIPANIIEKDFRYDDESLVARRSVSEEAELVCLKREHSRFGFILHGELLEKKSGIMFGDAGL